MDLKWLISDPTQGARSIEEIKVKARFPKSNNLCYNFCEVPINIFLYSHQLCDN